MSEPLQSSTATESDPQLDHAVASLEATAERIGLSPTPEADRPAESVTTGNSASAVDEGEGRREHSRSNPDLPDPWKANRDFVERQRQKDEQRRQQQLLDLIAEQLETSGRLAAQEPSPGVAEPEDPQPDMAEDFGAYQEWRDRQLLKQFKAELDQRLAPVTSVFDQQRQQYEQQAALAQQRDNERRWLEENAALAREAAEIYAQTEEGQDYLQRLAWQHGVPGDPSRGVPRQPGVTELGLLAAGFPPDFAADFSRRSVHAFHQLAVQHGLNPVLAMDRMTRVTLAASQQFYGAYYPQPGGEAQALPQVPAAPVSQEVRQLRQTAQAARGVAAVSEGRGAASEPKDVAGLLRSGDMSPAAIKKMAVKMYGSASADNVRKVTRQMTEAIEKLRASA